jgi:hypothetical protein
MTDDSGYQPPGPNDDAVTYLPIDRAKERAIPFGPTDLRASKPTGGIRIGKTFVFVLDEAMPRLAASHIGLACDNIVRGQESYASLVYLSRAKMEDLDALFEASQSYEIKVRWERLWVLSPHLARLARQKEAQESIIAAFKEDLAGLHLISKFAEQNNPAVKRLFARLHDAMLVMLMDRLHAFLEDGRRAALLSGIIATVETQESVLREAIDKSVDAAKAETMLGMLYLKPGSGQSGKLSANTLKGKLEGWRRS